VLRWLDVAQDHQCVIDSLPIPAVQFHLVPSSTGDWAAYGATFRKSRPSLDTSCTCWSPWAGSFLILSSPLPM
jgi:hypothetical protein